MRSVVEGRGLIRTLLHTAYQLRRHCLGAWSLDRWGVTAVLMAVALILLRWFVAGMPVIPAWHWGLLAALLLSAASLVYLGRWARRRMYVIFDPQSDRTPPIPLQLDPADKVLVYATGQFEVESKSRFFTDLLAYWRTFASREHTVMAIVHRSRYLLLGQVAEQELGMWYIFFQPQMIEGIVPGMLVFGRARRAALRVSYRCTLLASSQRKPSKPVTRVIYLGFEDEAGRQAVWSDLLGDHVG